MSEKHLVTRAKMLLKMDAIEETLEKLHTHRRQVVEKGEPQLIPDLLKLDASIRKVAEDHDIILEQVTCLEEKYGIKMSWNRLRTSKGSSK